MPTLVILATGDAALADAWEQQLSPSRVAIRLGSDGFPNGSATGLAAVVVLDAVSEVALPANFVRCPTIFVGRPRTLPFEQARMSGRAKVYLSYEESATKLRDFLPLLEELAEKQSLVEILTEKTRRFEAPRLASRSSVGESAELWDFIEGAVENIDSRDRLIAEFRRVSRHLIRASHAVFFLREGDGFRADRGTSFFSTDDPLVAFFENHPAVIDSAKLDSCPDAIAELSVRNRLALWGARMLVPVHDNGRLLGLIALGVRDDGQSYDDGDRTRAVSFARLLRHFLAKASHFTRLNHIAEQSTLGSKYLPGTLVLRADESAPRHVPLVVRDAIGHVRRSKTFCRVTPSAGQPFRASAGVIAETGGVWAFWEEASGEVHDAINREQRSRREVLRELALTLSHELGNALVSLTTFRQATTERPMPPPLVETVKADVGQLETLNNHLALMQTLHEAIPSEIDVRDVARSIGKDLGVKVEVGPDVLILNVNGKLLEYALRSLVNAVAVNRRKDSVGDLALKVRSTGAGVDLTVLVSLKGKELELEGILPEPVDGAIPNQGRMSVFIAKEILRIHHGEIHAGPGIEGTEILISFRSW